MFSACVVTCVDRGLVTEHVFLTLPCRVPRGSLCTALYSCERHTGLLVSYCIAVSATQFSLYRTV
jgi:hypothetical protein